MPVIIPEKLPAYRVLRDEGAAVLCPVAASAQARVLIVNLMPTKESTETQLLRLIAKSEITFEVDFLRMLSHRSKNTSQAHLDAFYKGLCEIAEQEYAAAIITGAPVERLPFEQVDYWQELCEVMDWADKNVASTLYLCWGAQAGLYYHYGIDKHELGQKLSGVYSHEVCLPGHTLMRDIPTRFFAPHSRYTAIDEEKLGCSTQLEILAKSDICGAAFVANSSLSRVFITGHIEYDPDTLAWEYHRDVKKGISPNIPENYAINTDGELLPRVNWSETAALFYTNWLSFSYLMKSRSSQADL